MTVLSGNSDDHDRAIVRTQRLIVMRHGQRWDDPNRAWLKEPGVRTWDPPLTDEGIEQSRKVGEELRRNGVSITRIFVSPFLRCLQTARGFITGMYPEGTHDCNLKVHIEYGLSENMNNRAIRYPPPSPHNTEDWTLPLHELLSCLPMGVADTSLQPVFPKLPDWEETTEAGFQRYSNVFRIVADQFPDENILCISHGEGIIASAKHVIADLIPPRRIPYADYTIAEREVYNPKLPLETGSWNLLKGLAQTPEAGSSMTVQRKFAGNQGLVSGGSLTQESLTSDDMFWK